VERFFERPKDFVAAFLAREDRKLDKELWRKEEIGGMRAKLFNLIVQLHGDYERFELERMHAQKQGKMSSGGDEASGKKTSKDGEGPESSKDDASQVEEVQNGGGLNGGDCEAGQDEETKCVVVDSGTTSSANKVTEIRTQHKDAGPKEGPAEKTTKRESANKSWKKLRSNYDSEVEVVE
jgi:hypothetical protein